MIATAARATTPIRVHALRWILALLVIGATGCVSSAKARILDPPAASIPTSARSDEAYDPNREGHRTLAAVRTAWVALRVANPEDNPAYASALTDYNAAVRDLLNTLFLDDSDGYKLLISDTTIDDASIRVGDVPGDWAPGFFNHFIECSRIEVSGFANHHATAGIGVPLIGIRARELTPGVVKYPPEGLAYPVTAVVMPDEEGGIIARLMNPLNCVDAKIGRTPAPIAADLTTPYGYILAKTKLVKLGRTGLFRYESSSWHEGLFVLQPYDPKKIPLIMVHGLVSSPATWKEMTNEIWGDSELRTRYQIWHYMYPTSTPPLTAARHFRDALRRTCLALDAEQDDFATQNVVLLGHSLGGLLCKALVAESGDRLWYRRYERSLDEAMLDPEARAIAEGTFFLSPEPNVRRVIFMATPTKGAHIAGSWFARLVARFVRPEGSAAMLESKVYSRDPDLKARLRLPNSIKVLNPSYPVMDEFGKIPVSPSVPFHTVIGSRDTVVPYESSHIDGAASERVVKSGHDVTSNPDAIREVERILKLQVQGAYTGAHCSFPSPPLN